MGERIGSRAGGGEEAIVAPGREARRGARICSVRGGVMGAAIVGLECGVASSGTITCKLEARSRDRTL